MCLQQITCMPYTNVHVHVHVYIHVYYVCTCIYTLWIGTCDTVDKIAGFPLPDPLTGPQGVGVVEIEATLCGDTPPQDKHFRQHQLICWPVQCAETTCTVHTMYTCTYVDLQCTLCTCIQMYTIKTLFEVVLQCSIHFTLSFDVAYNATIVFGLHAFRGVSEYVSMCRCASRSLSECMSECVYNYIHVHVCKWMCEWMVWVSVQIHVGITQSHASRL